MMVYCCWFIVIYISLLFRWKCKKTKKINFKPPLPSALTIALGKARNWETQVSQLCRLQWQMHSAKRIYLKKQVLPSAGLRHSAKIFKFFSLLSVTLGKEFFFKKTNFFAECCTRQRFF
jgi:hypothetical protein